MVRVAPFLTHGVYWQLALHVSQKAKGERKNVHFCCRLRKSFLILATVETAKNEKWHIIRNYFLQKSILRVNEKLAKLLLHCFAEVK